MSGFLDSSGNRDNQNNRIKIDIPKKSSDGNIFFKLLKNLSNYGMDYRKLIRNSKASGKYEDPTQSYDQFSNDLTTISNASAIALSNIFETKNIAALDTNYLNKRWVIRDYAAKPEIKNFVNIVCYDAIKYGHTNNFCFVSSLNGNYPEDVQRELISTFKEIYNKLQFNIGRRAERSFRKLLVDGYVAMEIIYDDDMKKIIGFKELDPTTLLPNYDYETGSIIWTQFATSPGITRILLDSQIIFLSYSTLENVNEVSYVEPLIMEYNKLHQLEVSLYMSNIMLARNYNKFTVPTDGLPPKKKAEFLLDIMSNFKEDIRFDSSIGQATINGSPNIPYNKDFFFQVDGTTMEHIKQDGYDMNEDNMLKWLDLKFKQMSMIPLSRFNRDNGGGVMFTQEADITREEMYYSNFINSLRTNWKEILIKPIYIQMILKFPYLKDDENFRNELDIIFDDDNKFKKTMELKNLNSQAGIFNTIKDLKRKVGEEEIPMFADDFMIKKIFDFTPEEIKQNEEMLVQQMAKYKRLSKVLGGNKAEEGGGEESGGETESGGEEPSLGL